MTTVARLRQQNECLLDDKLKEQERFEAAIREVGDRALEAGTTAIMKAAKVMKDTLHELESGRNRWERRAKKSEKEVALLETELDEVQQERDNLKKTVRKLKANILNV
jgi:SMC interacting uncharacterized protein involved in chromosome segregation